MHPLHVRYESLTDITAALEFVRFVPIADIRGQEGPLATPLVTSLAAAISTDPLRETRSLDAVAGFLSVKRWVKKSPDGTTGLVSNMASCPMAGPDLRSPENGPL